MATWLIPRILTSHSLPWTVPVDASCLGMTLRKAPFALPKALTITSQPLAHCCLGGEAPRVCQSRADQKGEAAECARGPSQAWKTVQEDSAHARKRIFPNGPFLHV